MILVGHTFVNFDRILSCVLLSQALCVCVRVCVCVSTKSIKQLENIMQ